MLFLLINIAQLQNDKKTSVIINNCVYQKDK